MRVLTSARRETVVRGSRLGHLGQSGVLDESQSIVHWRWG